MSINLVDFFCMYTGFSEIIFHYDQGQCSNHPQNDYHGNCVPRTLVLTIPKGVFVFTVGLYSVNRFTNLPITLSEKQVILQSFHDYSAWPKLKTLIQLCSLFLTCTIQITTNNHFASESSSSQTSGSHWLIL